MRVYTIWFTGSDFHQKMRNKLGVDFYNKLKREQFFKNYKWETIQLLVDDMQEKPESWNGLNYLNHQDPIKWERCLYKVLRIAKISPYEELVDFIKISSLSWDKSISDLINGLNIPIDTFFELEKKVNFDVSNVFDCVNILQKEVLPNLKADISIFVTRTHYAFLPKNVYLVNP